MHHAGYLCKPGMESSQALFESLQVSFALWWICDEVFFPLTDHAPSLQVFAPDKDDKIISYSSKPVACMQSYNIQPAPNCMNSDQAFMEQRFSAEENSGRMRTHSDEPSITNFCDSYYNAFPQTLQTQDFLCAQSVFPDQPSDFPERRTNTFSQSESSNNTTPVMTGNYVRPESPICSMVQRNIFSVSGSDGFNISKNIAGSSNFTHTTDNFVTSTAFSGAVLT